MATAHFHDHFSGHAADYAAHRPRYPAQMYDWLASQCSARGLALDVGTGNGQAALELAGRFDAVYATDASEEQIAQAPETPNVTWAVEPAERCSLHDESADLVTVAQALHWFAHDRFFAEIARVLRPGGVFAAWCYELLNITPAIDAAILAFYQGDIDPHWPPERRHIERGYRDIAIPMPAIKVPTFEMRATWTREQLLHYIGTWSAVRRHERATGSNALPQLVANLEQLWPEPEPKLVRFPLVMRAARKSD